MSPLTLRIFISSPGDVAVERERTGDVLRCLQDEFSHSVRIEPFFWENEPSVATAGFQDQIPPPSEMDIVVCILWARIGTRLPPDKVKPDGTPYASGTEFELEDAARGFRERGTPDLLVYRKTSDQSLPLANEAERRQRLEQLAALEALIKRWFFHEDSTFKAAFRPFKTADEFARQLELHLRVLIRRKIEAWEGEGGPGAGEIIVAGLPYVGLEAFELAQAPVFYGRSRALASVKEAMRTQTERGCAFLLILGMSGSGKSSLVRSGLLHALARTPGFIPEIELWRWCVVRPGDPLEALSQALFGDHALPELRAGSLDAERLVRLLRENPRDIDVALRPALRAAAEAEQMRKQSDRLPAVRLLVVVDQMEEIFTGERIDARCRAEFVAALSALARSGLAWVVATMRSDFYPRCAELPELIELKSGAGQYDLLPPTFAEIGQMIRYPARDAGLRWERDPASPDRFLDDVLQEAAARDPKALPLLQFTLRALFEHRAEGRVLTFASYNDLGGLEGALARRAEDKLSRLDAEAQATLAALLRSLVNVVGGDRDSIVSRRVPLPLISADPARQRLLYALINARLLTTDLDAGGRPVVGVAHEALLGHWPRLREILEKDLDFLRTRTRVADAAALWRREAKDPAYALAEGKPLAEARDLLERRRDDLDPDLLEYIEASVRQANRTRRRRFWIIASAATAFFVVVSSFGAFSYVEWRKAEANLIFAHKSSGVAWYNRKEYRKALADYNKAIELDPRDKWTLNHRGIVLRAMGDYPKAIAAHELARRIDPEDAATHNSLAWLWATCPEARYRNGKGAVESAEIACNKTQWKNGIYLDTLAAAYAEEGEFDKAIRREMEAVRLLAGDEESRKEGENRLVLYKAHKPYRDGWPRP